MGNVNQLGNQLMNQCSVEYAEFASRRKTFEDRWAIDDSNPIGTGKFSEVFLCWKQDHPEDRYALKVINTIPDDNASINQIHAEINILRTLGNHPNIIQLVDVDAMEGSNCIRLVAELCEGGELYQRIIEKEYYAEMEAKLLLCNLLEAVVYIHSKGIMHRDLKPENILLVSKDNDTDIKISDFGLAKMSKDFPNRLPRATSICGSDFYLAPEVLRQEEYGREIDIWAVGVITYSLLSGALPFFHNVLHKLYRQIMERDMNFDEPQWRMCSKGAQDFILRLVQLRAGDRLTAEQASNHPWLSGPTSPMHSFSRQNSHSPMNSFDTRQNSNQKSFFGGVPPPEGAEHQNHYLQNPYERPNSPRGQPAKTSNYYASQAA